MEFGTIPARELDRYVQENGTVILDLRSPEEYRKQHIRGAVNFPCHSDKEKRMEFIYPKDKEYVLYCARGAVSLAAARELAARGYRVKTVVGGIRAYRGHYLEKGF
ncbi:MAG: rhodanese-like domain-containing protein [Lachnospiraceae bacterium]|nr:rhodanese-like domain-containing protein [Lachnospiraceae bacterium]MDD3796710.1 rhodanese-like domain-containing protein [Lachnospiraceae bacterium]